MGRDDAEGAGVRDGACRVTRGTEGDISPGLFVAAVLLLIPLGLVMLTGIPAVVALLIALKLDNFITGAR